MSQYHLHVLLHCMHLFRLASLYVGRAPYDTWPFACVVTLYAFVSLGLFCVGLVPYEDLAVCMCCYVVCICFAWLVLRWVVPYEHDCLHVLLRYMHSFRLASCMSDELRTTLPFACVVTLYAFVLLALFCVGRAPYVTVPS